MDATTTRQAPPTEAEIRAAILARLQDKADSVFDEQADLVDAFDRIATAAADPLVKSAANTLEIDGGSLWEPLRQASVRALWFDLRPSQAAELVDLIQQACERVQARCEAIVLEELVAVGVQFAAQHPDAPRPDKSVMSD